MSEDLIAKNDWIKSEKRMSLIKDYKNELICNFEQPFEEYFEKVIKLLDGLDFWDCPASTRFHGSEYGGLLKHSLNVLNIARHILRIDESLFPFKIDKSSLFRAILFHDICKCHCYQPNILKNGSYSQATYTGKFKFVSDRGIGYHGDKSVALLLEAGIKLNDEEINYIRWHMGPYTVEGMQTWNKIKSQFPEVEIMSICDQLASALEGSGD